MSVQKYRIKVQCLSCRHEIRGTAVVVVSHTPEDQGEERAFLVHESCQDALIRHLPYSNAADQNTITGRPKL